VELAGKLVAHDGIEREIFYPACKEAMGMTELLGEAMVEHGVIEFSLYLADQAQGKKDFDDKVNVLCEMVEHHVKEEEHELFPKVQKAMTDELLRELGAKMEARFEAATKEDFRAPLHENLRLVLEGASEIPATKKAKETAAKQVRRQERRRPEEGRRAWEGALMKSKIFFALGLVLGLSALGCDKTPGDGPRVAGTPADNSKKNERDRDSATLTPGDQGENEVDRGITQKIRQEVIKADGLSMNAKNVKIITPARWSRSAGR
jgi:hypothetical protein